jgi:undecaprenyl-diphosphatase
MTYYLLFLCLAQGITEFLPVSSSAHMMMVTQWFGVIKPDAALYVGLHFGTLLSIMAFYFKDIILMTMAFIHGSLCPYKRRNDNFNLALCLLMATIPALIVGFLIKPYIAHLQNNLTIIAFSSIIFGSLLAFIDDYMPINDDQITKKRALLIGIGQLLAFFPGGSRLGTTITVARILGMSRAASFRFSMLLSIPVVLGASVLMGYDAYQCGAMLFDKTLAQVVLITFILGMATLFVMTKFINRIGFSIFGIYRVLFGICILLWFFATQ